MGIRSKRVCSAGQEIDRLVIATSAQPGVIALTRALPLQELQEDRVNEKVDVFSFGVVMWEIWTWAEQPYPGLGLPEIFAVCLFHVGGLFFRWSSCHTIVIRNE